MCPLLANASKRSFARSATNLTGSSMADRNDEGIEQWTQRRLKHHALQSGTSLEDVVAEMNLLLATGSYDGRYGADGRQRKTARPHLSRPRDRVRSTITVEVYLRRYALSGGIFLRTPRG